MSARARTLLCVAVMLALLGCSDAKPSAGAASSPFNPFASDASAGVTKPAPPPATLAVGDCFNTDRFAPGLSIALRDVHLVACTDSHQHEVYAIEGNATPAGSSFPGDVAMNAFADDACLAAFEPALGVGYRASSLDFATIRPDATTWKAGDRAVICAVHDADFVALTGSRLATPSSTTTTSTSLAAKDG